MNLEEFLFDFRKKYNKTPKEMSEILKLTENRYKDIEGKKIKPSIKEICTINIYLKKNGYDGYDEKEMINLYKPKTKNKNTVRYISNIRNLRTKANLRMQDVADIIGVHINTIYKWESGLTKPSKERIDFLQELFHSEIKIRKVLLNNDKNGV